jgi:hypothetical protein
MICGRKPVTHQVPKGGLAAGDQLADEVRQGLVVRAAAALGAEHRGGVLGLAFPVEVEVRRAGGRGTGTGPGWAAGRGLLGRVLAGQRQSAAGGNERNARSAVERGRVVLCARVICALAVSVVAGAPLRDLEKSRREPARALDRADPNRAPWGAAWHGERSSGSTGEKHRPRRQPWCLRALLRGRGLALPQPGGGPAGGGDPGLEGRPGHPRPRRLSQGRPSLQNQQS